MTYRNDLAAATDAHFARYSADAQVKDAGAAWWALDARTKGRALSRDERRLKARYERTLAAANQTEE